VESSNIDYSRKWLIMAAVAMGVFLATIDSSIVNVALPTFVRELNTNFATVQWVVLAYLLTIATLLLSVGRLADMRGKKTIYLIGFIVFTTGSALCGLSPNIYMLIGARVLQAIGSSAILALGMAIVTEAFPPHERGKALGINGAIVSIGIVVGPSLGGLIIGATSWHWIFFVNIPIGFVGIWMVFRFVPNIKPKGDQVFDIAGAFTLLISLLSFLIALTLGQQIGFITGPVIVLLVNWLLFLILFLYTEVRVKQPMIDLEIFKNLLFSINLIIGAMTFIAIAGTTILIPFFLENVLGYQTYQVGFLMAIIPVTMGLIAPIAGSLSDRFGTRPITVIGLIILLFGYICVQSLDENTHIIGYILRFLPIGLGMGVFQSPNNSAIMGEAPRERLGIVSGMLALTRTLGQTTGIAILGAVWASRVFFYAGGVIEEGATSAPASAQVAGLQDTVILLIILIAIALGIGLWGYFFERKQRTVPSVTISIS
jgi:EmrB/QacA subfamily drug resistance transporter